MKTFLTTIFLLLCAVSFAQNVSPKLLKGIEVTTDEFTGAKTYSAKNCCLSITQEGDSVKLYISLSCSAYDSPVKLKKIQILTNGMTTTVDDTSNFSNKEVPTRIVTSNATGKFGTASYKGAQFGTRMQYVDVWKAEATPYLPMIKSIISNLGKVKFEGDNNTLILEFNKKDTKKMDAILQIYEYLTSQ